MILLGLGKIKVPDRAYNNPALRHELRMKPFLRIDYPPVPNWQHVVDSLPQRSIYSALGPKHLEDAGERYENMRSFALEYAPKQLDDLRKIEPGILGRRFTQKGWNKVSGGSDRPPFLQAEADHHQELAKYEQLVESLSEWVNFLQPFFVSEFTQPPEAFSVEIPPPKNRVHPFFLVPILKRTSTGEGDL
jgi:hypothetical protein